MQKSASATPYSFTERRLELGVAEHLRDRAMHPGRTGAYLRYSRSVRQRTELPQAKA